MNRTNSMWYLLASLCLIANCVLVFFWLLQGEGTFMLLAIVCAILSAWTMKGIEERASS